MDGLGTEASSTETSAGRGLKNVMVLAATNRPWDLDEAIRRRLEKRICKFLFLFLVSNSELIFLMFSDIPLPTAAGRKQLFDINLKGIKIDEGIDYANLIAATEGYSGADLANICRDASLMPLRRRMEDGNVDIQHIHEV